MKQLLNDMLQVVRLIEGLEGAFYTCGCRRVMKVGISSELKALLPRVKEGLKGAAKEEFKDEELGPDTKRFGLIEVDE